MPDRIQHSIFARKWYFLGVFVVNDLSARIREIRGQRSFIRIPAEPV